MAGIEDEAEFGSQFWDSMLEVEMREDDNELDISKNTDPLETLPPIPTFDLQSETYSYKNAYKNAVPQPVVAAVPNPAATVPMIFNPNSVLVKSGGLSNFPTSNVVATRKTTVFPVKKPTKNATSVTVYKDECSAVVEPPIEKFVEEVFRPELVKNVFVKADPPWDIACVSDKEMEYYKTCFKDVTKVQHCRLHCTICDKHLGCATSTEKKITIHTMLKVLTCKTCHEFYGDGNFPCDKGDNCEIYCRWCGQGGALVCCSFCPRVFCKKCVKRNFGPGYLKMVEKAEDWACFCCAQKPLWPHRAICRALIEYIALKKTDPTYFHKDLSACCKLQGLSRRKSLNTTGKISPVATPKTTPGKAVPSSKPNGPKISVKPLVQLKAAKSPVKPKPTDGVNIFSPRSIISGNSIIRGVASSNTNKLFSSFSSPQLIQTPVIHGETLITPPSRFLVQAKPPVQPPAALVAHAAPFVRVSLTHQAQNLDVSKMPTVKIPSEVQGLVLRLIFPDNKIQYVRLTSDDKSPREFPMPQFKEKGSSFVEKNLVRAYEVSKAVYEKLSKVKDKVTSRTKFTEESVFNSSVKKLQLAYRQAMELYQELDRSLSEGYEQWKKSGKASVDVIDISDDEGSGTTAARKSKTGGVKRKRGNEEDSDVEILEDVVANGTSSKEKHKSKTKNNGTGPSPSRKRRRGRSKKTGKRLKLQNGDVEETKREEDTETGNEGNVADENENIEENAGERVSEDVEENVGENASEDIGENIDENTVEDIGENTVEDIGDNEGENMNVGENEGENTDENNEEENVGENEEENGGENEGENEEDNTGETEGENMDEEDMEGEDTEENICERDNVSENVDGMATEDASENNNEGTGNEITEELELKDEVKVEMET